MQHQPRQSRLLASAAPVIQPWDYVRLRRIAAGVSIEQAASHYWHHPEHRADVEAMVRRQEEVGYHPTSAFGAEDMSRAYPFSLAVYEQLCTLPADQHPRLCTGCGWDQWTDQTDTHGYQLRWSRKHEHLCTACARKADGKGAR